MEAHLELGESMMRSMKKTMLLGLSALMAASCSTTLHGSIPAPGVIASEMAQASSYEGEAAVAGPSYGAGDDLHWIQADDFWISDRPYESGWIRLTLAKMKQPPTQQTKGEALFFNLHESKDQWTGHFWKTRLAEPADLFVGALILCFEGNLRDDVYHAPQDKQSARTEAWFMGRITDASDLYKGSVMVDTYKCAPKALRAFLR
jgi:hypothetical protein